MTRAGPLAALQQRLVDAVDGRRQIALLRQTLASTEDLAVICAVATCVSELAETCADDLLDEAANLKDRVAAKADALGVDLAAVRRPRDEVETFDVRGRDFLLENLRTVHGEPRPDIAPELIAVGKVAPP
jgi:hypothetical protein